MYTHKRFHTKQAIHAIDVMRHHEVRRHLRGTGKASPCLISNAHVSTHWKGKPPADMLQRLPSKSVSILEYDVSSYFKTFSKTLYTSMTRQVIVSSIREDSYTQNSLNDDGDETISLVVGSSLTWRTAMQACRLRCLAIGLLGRLSHGGGRCVWAAHFLRCPLIKKFKMGPPALKGLVLFRKLGLLIFSLL